MTELEKDIMHMLGILERRFQELPVLEDDERPVAMAKLQELRRMVRARPTYRSEFGGDRL